MCNLELISVPNTRLTVPRHHAKAQHFKTSEDIFKIFHASHEVSLLHLSRLTYEATFARVVGNSVVLVFIASNGTNFGLICQNGFLNKTYFIGGETRFFNKEIVILRL